MSMTNDEILDEIKVCKDFKKIQNKIKLLLESEDFVCQEIAEKLKKYCWLHKNKNSLSKDEKVEKLKLKEYLLSILD